MQRFEDLSSADYQKRSETKSLYIPPGPRLGELVIEANHISKSFGDKLLYDDLNFSLPRGGIVGIIGANGAGKTTTIKMLAGVMRPTSGRIFIHGLDLQKHPIEVKARVGFMSKYKRGQTEPTGQTQFRFKAAGLDFHSDSYQWLVIAGHKAMYKGTGTINGEGEYDFMLSAIDAKLTPSTDVDLFRIKIWEVDNADAVIYDNAAGAIDDADPTTVLGGGSIVIHKK